MVSRSLVLAACALPALAQVPTAQYDNARTGANLHETALTPANVNRAHFGKLFRMEVDGDIYAQPLYVPGVEIPGQGRHNVVFVATEHDSVYAFDAEHAGPPLWHVNFLTKGATTVSAGDVHCPFIRPEIGITPTPVIDMETGTLYVLARTKESGGLFGGSTFAQRLHALAITTGVEKFGGPVEIKASAGQAAFSPLRDNPRAALLLANGTVYLSWASSCDVATYHGWVMSYDARTLKQKSVWNAAGDSEESGIWQGDAGPAADAQGNVYLATGNGRFNAAAGGHDYGDSAVKLSAGDLRVLDYFTPFNEREMNANDDDLGSGGPVLVPPNLLAVGGKDRMLYLIDRDRMGKYHAGDDSHAVQTIRLRGMIMGAPAFWNGRLFVLASNDVLREFKLEGARLTPGAVAAERFIDPGATPTVSANGTRDGIVWVIEQKGWRADDRPAVLHAYEAVNVAHELYTSEQNGVRDRAGLVLRFSIPTVVNGRVYVGTKKGVDVYGSK
jgi:hypothetical protein